MLLEEKVKDFVPIYLSEENMNGFYQLKDVIETLKKNGEKEDDIKKYKEVTENFLKQSRKIN